MRIAIVTAVFPPYRGGMSNVAETHARLLSGLGHEVTVFAPGKGEEETAAGYRVVRLRPSFAIGKGAFVPRIGSHLGGFDAVFLHYPAFGLAEPMLAWRLAAGRKNRFFVVYHMDPIAPGVKGLVFRALRLLALQPLLESADSVVVASLDYARSGILGAMPDRVKMKYEEVPFPLDTAAFAPRQCGREDKERFGIGKADLVFVGGMDRAHWFKGVSVLLKAVKEADVPGLKLHLVGSGGLVKRYESEARRLGIGDRVVFHGSLTDEELPKILSCADALVLPSVSRSEAFGLVLMEAMASGKPVIATRLPGVRTVVREGETGLLAEPGDTGSLSRAIKGLFSDPSLMRSMGERARKEAVMRWDSSVTRAGLAKLLEREDSRSE